jgi:hypothetical protein
VLRIDDRRFTVRRPDLALTPDQLARRRAGEPPELALSYAPAPAPRSADPDDGLPF